jgi:hypothetical protein
MLQALGLRTASGGAASGAQAGVGDPDAEADWVPRGGARGRGGARRGAQTHRFKLIFTSLTGCSLKVLN